MKNYHQDPRALNVPRYLSPFFESLSRSLTDADRELSEAYRDHGYVVLDVPVIDTDTVDRVVSELDGRYDDVQTGHDTPNRKLDAWRESEAVVEVANAPSVLRALEVLYGRRAFPFQTLNFLVGTEQGAHSDTVHFHSIPHRFMAGVWVALEDIHPDSGPLVVYPGSHKLPCYDPFDLAIEAKWEAHHEYEAAIEAIVGAFGLEPRPLTLKRGQAVIWEANLLHGGSMVRDTTRTRLSQATHYYFEDCTYYQPAVSEPFVGRLSLKRVEAVGSGRVVPNLYRGRPVEEWSKGPSGLRRMLARFTGGGRGE
ncbi:MAG: phytanoyl-CoA dioxygenase family protein [Gemmatimonadota bacterium]|nr:phytanoyl-CoA dioxygenase family protein [Gemmatimonadota bacterium]